VTVLQSSREVGHLDLLVLLAVARALHDNPLLLCADRSAREGI